MDQMVLKTQQYLNAMYGGTPGYNVIVEDGLTGWSTIYALTRAFQIEMGLSSPADSFGNATKEAFKQRYPNGIVQQDSSDTTTSRVYAIIQGALWCKGYSTGGYGISEHFYGGTGSAVISLKEDAGIENPDSTVTLNVMKGLLSMDQYKLVSGGTPTIREIQQQLNQKYESYLGLIPCDGLYGREMNKGLIMVLQAILGLSVDGVFGNGTKKACPTLPDDMDKLSTEAAEDLIVLIRYALCCNGINANIYIPWWEPMLELELKNFQINLMLSVTGKADIDTWMSLLLSKGNPDRSCTACDTRFEITSSRANELKEKGYQIVGRYLTGTDFKVLRDDEPQRILDNGLYFFPIFQESSTNVSYFTVARGKADAENAVRAARKFGIPEGSVIYFAVDLDATAMQIKNYVLPYFASLMENMDTAYLIGIYGTRNVCTQVYNAGYAVTSFVSDMSTGYSGNMGFMIPPNWNFDQYAEISMETTTDGAWAIDKDAYTGKYPPVTSLNPYVYEQPPKPVRNDPNKIGSLTDVLKDIEALEDLYVAWYKPLFEAAPNVMPYLSANVLAEGVTRFLRSGVYNNALWKLTLRASDEGFISYVIEHNSELYQRLYNYMIYESDGGHIVSDERGGFINLKHVAAAAEGIFTASVLPDAWYGWVGDIASVIATTESYAKENDCSYQDAASVVVGDDTRDFSYIDMCADADAIKIAELISQSTSRTHSFSEALRDYYNNYVDDRFLYLLDDIGCKANLTDINKKLMSNTEIVVAEVAFYIGKQVINPPEEIGELVTKLIAIPTSDACKASCAAFANYIYCELE